MSHSLCSSLQQPDRCAKLNYKLKNLMRVQKDLLLVWPLKSLVLRTRYSKKYLVKKSRSRSRPASLSSYSSERKSNLRQLMHTSDSSLHSTDLPSMSPTLTFTSITIKSAKFDVISLLITLRSLCISTKMYFRLLGKSLNKNWNLRTYRDGSLFQS